jgi:glutathione S-transferase
MLQILGKASSINVRKVLWACHELALPYEIQQWGVGDRSMDEPAFRTLNPNSMMPVIRDGDFVLWESNAICRYLAAEYGATEYGAAEHGRAALLPSALRERAIVEQWMDWQATELNNSWRYAFTALVRRRPTHTDRSAIEAGVIGWNRHMSILDERLRSTGSFVAGREFTLADIVLGLSTHRWLMTPMERPALPAVSAYYERLSERPGFLVHGRNGNP